MAVQTLSSTFAKIVASARLKSWSAADPIDGPTLASMITESPFRVIRAVSSDWTAEYHPVVNVP